jgi:hypothetical protein
MLDTGGEVKRSETNFSRLVFHFQQISPTAVALTRDFCISGAICRTASQRFCGLLPAHQRRELLSMFARPSSARVKLFGARDQRLGLVLLYDRALRHLVAGRRARKSRTFGTRPRRQDIRRRNAAQDSLQCRLNKRSSLACLERFDWRLLNLLERARRTHFSGFFGEKGEKFKL